MSTDLDALFVEGCDPYRVAASVLLGKAPESITQDDRDSVKRVFMRVVSFRDESFRRSNGEKPLRQAADMFHEIGSAHEARRLLDREGHKLPQVMYDDFTKKLRDPAAISKIASDGFELCVRALAAMGAPDVTIHECGTQALGEEPWGSENVE